ncbi:PREDICTED: acyl-CoA-binding domain-containing protein 5 [Propithecus coquereli]|uniref:acyl-CoA-binding domain-containing protein 5 n=1 Tax=Propithecus coquereli TaxID=379532 RepID=UPI00063F5531|nr:PREDICTED: acyl-CoA-binding domain-containing protein 5 [Propithecus coquereli]
MLFLSFHAGSWESWCCCCLIPADRPGDRGRRWQLEMADTRSVHETRFEAAVKVIQSLPKNGSFQPTNEMMLKFYSFYKQATEGPCKLSRPAFWDPIGRYKWDAWNSLGDMTKEEAMIAYVEEMKKSDLGNVLTSTPNAKTVNGKAESSDSGAESEEEEAQEKVKGAEQSDNDKKMMKKSADHENLEIIVTNGYDKDGFVQDIQNDTQASSSPNGTSTEEVEPVDQHLEQTGKTTVCIHQGIIPKYVLSILFPILETMPMTEKVEELLHVIGPFYEIVEDKKTGRSPDAKSSTVQTSNQPPSQRPSWWPFEISPGALTFAIIWPFIAQWLVHFYYQRRRRKLN